MRSGVKNTFDIFPYSTRYIPSVMYFLVQVTLLYRVSDLANAGTVLLVRRPRKTANLCFKTYICKLMTVGDPRTDTRSCGNWYIIRSVLVHRCCVLQWNIYFMLDLIQESRRCITCQTGALATGIYMYICTYVRECV